MKRLLFLASLAIAGALIFAPIDAPRVDAQTFSGQPSPQYLQIGQGAAQPKWLPITGCSLASPASLTCPYTSGTVPWANITSPPTTLAGYGITNARTQLAANTTYYVNGNSAVTTATTAAGNAVLHFAQGSGTTNNTTAAGNNVLHFAAVPVTIYVGATITDSTASVIPAATTVTAVTATTVTISNNATGGGVGNGDTIKWSLSVFPVGQQITDSTASVIPALTTISSIAFSTTTDVTISANVTGGGVGNGDTIKWQAACGTTGASTCGYGLDTNNGTAPATPFLTTQQAVNTIINTIDLNGFAVTVSLAHGASNNYPFTCTNGPVVGQSTFAVAGDSTARTAVGVVISSGGAISVKDLCTPTVRDMAFYDRPTNNGTAYISVATGASGHVDFSGLTFNSCTICTFVTGSYSGETITVTGANNQITGGANAAFSMDSGATFDGSSINSAFTVANNLTWGTAFAVATNGGTFANIVALGATGTFGNPSGHTGPRFFANGGLFGNSVDPNSLFPGSDAVATTAAFGAIALQNGSGASAAPVYGTLGQPICSGGSSSAKDTFCSQAQQMAFAPALMVIGRVTGVNFNSANSDNSITVTLPTGYTRYNGIQLIISNASASLTTSTYGLFTAAAGGGTAIIPGGTANTVSSSTDGATSNSSFLSAANGPNQSFTAAGFPTLFFRVGTAQGSAATGDVTIFGRPLP